MRRMKVSAARVAGLFRPAFVIAFLLTVAPGAFAAPASLRPEAAGISSAILVSDPQPTPSPTPEPKPKPTPPPQQPPSPKPEPSPAPEKPEVVDDGAVDNGPDARDSFIKQLRSKQSYPPRARELGIEGNVSLRISLDAQGRASEVKVLESSGSAILDEAALDLVGRALPFRHGGSGGLTMDITIDYHLTD
ncbi:MAG: energy transducer TonB [Spirochaetales bacterium]|nr:energy transducer TonB [Spirochaetales bacterium]